MPFGLGSLLLCLRALPGGITPRPAADKAERLLLLTKPVRLIGGTAYGFHSTTGRTSSAVEASVFLSRIPIGS